MPITEGENAVKIAVLEEQIRGVREQQKSHNESTQKRFDELNSKIELSVAPIADDVKSILASMNRGRGAYTASMLLASAIGAAVLTLIGNLSQLFHK